jgi:hypothetical protein
VRRGTESSNVETDRCTIISGHWYRDTPGDEVKKELGDQDGLVWFKAETHNLKRGGLRKAF